MIVLVAGYSRKGHALVTLEKNALHVHCSGQGKTELEAVLLGDRVLNQCDSFSDNMVLKGLCIGDTWEDPCSLIV